MLFIRLEKTLQQIKEKLCKDDSLIKLLTNDSPSALSEDSAESAEDKVFIAPYVTEIAHRDKTTFINIYTKEMLKDMARVVIDVYTSPETQLLDKGKVRLLRICDILHRELEGERFAFDGVVNFSNAEIIAIQSQYIGYSME